MLRRTMMASAIAALKVSMSAQADYRQAVLRKLARRQMARRLSIAQA